MQATRECSTLEFRDIPRLLSAYLFCISCRRLLVAGRMVTGWLENASTSATNSSSSDTVVNRAGLSREIVM